MLHFVKYVTFFSLLESQNIGNYNNVSFFEEKKNFTMPRPIFVKVVILYKKSHKKFNIQKFYARIFLILSYVIEHYQGVI